MAREIIDTLLTSRGYKNISDSIIGDKSKSLWEAQYVRIRSESINKTVVVSIIAKHNKEVIGTFKIVKEDQRDPKEIKKMIKMAEHYLFI